MLESRPRPVYLVVMTTATIRLAVNLLRTIPLLSHLVIVLVHHRVLTRRVCHSPCSPLPASPLSLSVSRLMAGADRVADHMASSPTPFCLPEIAALPCYEEMTEPLFSWGALDGPTCVAIINDCYNEAVCWKPNLFRLPAGRIGEQFVMELSRLSWLCHCLCSGIHRLEGCPTTGSSKNIHWSERLSAHIDRRLSLWQQGSFQELLCEGNTIQSHLSSKHYVVKKRTHIFLGYSPIL